MDAYIEHLNLFMVGDSTKIERFSEILSSEIRLHPLPRLLVFIGSMSLIFREEIQSLWGKVPAIVCGADPYVYHEKFYRQRDTVTPEEKTHMSELAEEFNFTYMHTPHLSGRKRATDVQDDSRYEETDFPGRRHLPQSGI